MNETLNSGTRVAVLGGGLAALASAHYAASGGHVPVLLGPGPRLGDDAGQIELAGEPVDRVPVRLSSTDTALCGLLAELGTLGRISWHPTRSSALVHGQPLPVGSARDVLRQPGIGLAQRVRAALGVLYSAELKSYALELDDVAASAWLPRVFGRSIYDLAWRPMLERRFGDQVDEVSAYWAWRLLHRMRQRTREIRGQIQGGAPLLFERLRDSVESRGGEVRLNTNVTAVESDPTGVSVEIDGELQRFDALISTLPPEQLRKLARGSLLARLPAESPDYLGRVTALVVTRRPVTRAYETTVIGDREPFQTIFETTNARRDAPSGRALVYLSYVCGAHTDAYKLSDDAIRERAVGMLVRHFDGLAPEDVERVEVTRQADAEPVHTVGALSRRPATRVEDTPVFLCSSAQLYPRAGGWDAEVSLARETCGMLELL